MALRPARGWLRPYLGGGIAAHVVNAEGRAISGTFVERALDNITAGVLGTAGVDAVVFQHVSLGMQARYDLLSGTRFGSLRLVGSYIFTPVRRPGIPARGPQ
jgi:outer membrane protein W